VTDLLPLPASLLILLFPATVSLLVDVVLTMGLYPMVGVNSARSCPRPSIRSL